MLLLRLGNLLNSILQIQAGPIPGTQDAETPAHLPGHPDPADPHHAAEIEHEHPELDDHNDPLLLDCGHHDGDFDC